MKQYSTNYYNTLVEVAEDTKAQSGTIPPDKNQKTMAAMQFDLVSRNPYKFTSDDIFFQVYADRNDVMEAEFQKFRELFFSKGQPCFRASPLTKTYGFGVHSDNEGKVALFGMETDEYQNLLNDPTIRKVKAMRSSRK